MRLAMLVCLGFAVVTTAACAEADRPACAEGTEQFVKYELFMGRSNQSGEVVDDAAWAKFLEDTVTPRFPDGLTVLDSQGQWRDSEGLVQKERSKLLVILVPPGDDGDAHDQRGLGRIQTSIRPGVRAAGRVRCVRFVLLMARSRGAYGSALARDARGFFASLKNDRGARRMALRCLCGSQWWRGRALVAGGRRFFGFAQNDRGALSMTGGRGGWPPDRTDIRGCLFPAPRL